MCTFDIISLKRGQYLNFRANNLLKVDIMRGGVKMQNGAD